MSSTASDGLSRIAIKEKDKESDLKKGDRPSSSDTFQDQQKTREKSPEKTENRKKYRFIFKICPPCTSCCCCASTIIGIVLFLIGIAALLVYLLTQTSTVKAIITVTS